MNIIPISKAAEDELHYIEGRQSGKIKSLATAWPRFNNVYMQGLEWGWIVLIGGLSGSGKTALLNMLETDLVDLNKDQDIQVLSFNFEMLARRLVGRKISHALKKSVKEVYSAEGTLSQTDLAEVRKQIEEYSKLPIDYVEIPGTPKEMGDLIVKYIKERIKPKNKGLVVTLDHSLLVRKQGDERETLVELASILNTIKKLYPKVLFVVLSQLNRKIEEEGRRSVYGNQKILQFPVKGDIFGSDALYQFSDAVIVPHRPELLGIQSYGPEGWPTGDIIYVHHLKTRDGEPQITRFRNLLKYNRLEEI